LRWSKSAAPEWRYTGLIVTESSVMDRIRKSRTGRSDARFIGFLTGRDGDLDD